VNLEVESDGLKGGDQLVLPAERSNGSRVKLLGMMEYSTDKDILEFVPVAAFDAVEAATDDVVDFNADGKNNLRAIKSRCGHKFLFDDGG